MIHHLYDNALMLHKPLICSKLVTKRGGGRLAKYCDIVPELLLVYCSILDIIQHIHQSLVWRKSQIFHFLSQQTHNDKELLLFIQLELNVDHSCCSVVHKILYLLNITLSHRIILILSFFTLVKI